MRSAAGEDGGTIFVDHDVGAWHPDREELVEAAPPSVQRGIDADVAGAEDIPPS